MPKKFEKLKTQRKQTASATALILVLTFSALMAAVSPVKASLEIPTFALLNVTPNPVGVGQIVYVSAFMSKPTPTAGMANSGDQYENITVQVIGPDGTKETLGPFRSDSTGGTYTTYTPTQTGTYTFQMFYPGQTLKVEPIYNGTIMKPSVSEIVSLVVQKEPIPTYSNTPLPTGYWSRPIYATNYAWAQLGGNWLGLRAPAFATTGMYDATGNVQLYSTAPDTSHIIWTKPTTFGGQVGSPISGDQESQYASTSIAINFFEPIIMNGIIYYTHFASLTSKIVSWEAVDLRTGQTLWTRTPGKTGNEVLRMGQVLRFKTVQEYGSVAYLWSTESAGFFQQPTFFGLYDAATGEYLANITGIQNPSFMTDVSGDQQGTLLGWYTTGSNLTLWNSTLLLAGKTFGTGYSITLRPTGTYNFSDGNQWSVPIATKIGDTNISSPMSIAATTPEVILMRSAPTPGMFSELNSGYQITAGYDAKTGKLLWGPINQTLPILQDTALLAARDGVYVLHNKDTNEAYGYSLTNGQQLWGPVKLPGNALSSISRSAEIAYGKVYIWDFGGYVNALDLQTGKINWTFTPQSTGYDNPYGTSPLWHFGTDSIADGKLFLSEGRMYNPPLYPNAQRLAINCSNGELVWSVLSFSGRCPAAIADGYMVEWNSYDSQIYTFGKGQTATTVLIQNDVITHGNSILIKGMVTDESPGTKNSDRVARFPGGVPAIADASMSPWMEYVYMQQPKPTNATGVPVTLSVFDSNNNTYTIGTTTSDVDGNFAFAGHRQFQDYTGSQQLSQAPTATTAPTQKPPS